MKRATFIREATLGGPGLDGYAYQADVYCVDCGRAIIEEIASAIVPRLRSLDDFFRDSELVPQPIFFGESDTAEHCGDCGEYLYGPKEEEGEVDKEEKEEEEEDETDPPGNPERWPGVAA